MNDTLRPDVTKHEDHFCCPTGIILNFTPFLLYNISKQYQRFRAQASLENYSCTIFPCNVCDVNQIENSGIYVNLLQTKRYPTNMINSCATSQDDMEKTDCDLNN